MEYYTEAFKRKMVQRMLLPAGPSASRLSQEVGVSQRALSRWLRQARTMGETGESDLGLITAGGNGMKKRPQDRTTKEKLRVVLETRGLSGEELGAYLRREGIHEAVLRQWRKGVEQGLSEKQGTGRHPEDVKRIHKLERELKRKEKALAEAAALLVLQKKVQALWGDEDESTPLRNGR